MDQRRGCHESVDHGGGSRSRQASPLVRDWSVDGKDPLGVVGGDTRQPPLEGSSLARVPSTHQLDSPAKLTDHEHAEIDLIDRDVLEPRAKMDIRASALPKLGEDVRVQQKAQRRARRGFPLRRAKSESWPAAGIWRSSSLSDFAPRPGRNTARRISRCSASIERPLRAARLRSSATTSGSSLRTMSCAISLAASNDSTREDTPITKARRLERESIFLEDSFAVIPAPSPSKRDPSLLTRNRERKRPSPTAPARHRRCDEAPDRVARRINQGDELLVTAGEQLRRQNQEPRIVRST